MQGIKDTKEAIIGLVVLGVYIAKRAKDGINSDDAADFAQKMLTDSEFREKLQAAIDGFDNIPDELKHIGFAQVLDLATVIPEIVSILSEK